MTFETWITFVIASSIISIIPGPSVFTILSQSIAHGLKAALLCVCGDVLGGVVVMLLSYAGVGAILAASEPLFLLVKWLGILYIAYLGCLQIIEANKIKGALTVSEQNIQKSSSSIRVGFFTGLLNPKAIMFSMAFLSQFIDANSNQVNQLLILIVTSSILIFFILGAYALLAAKIKNILTSSKSRKRMGYISGGCLFSGSAFMIFVR